MKYLIIISIFLTSCTPTLNTKILCRHKALSVATAVRQHYPVRIAIGKWKGINHVQSQAKINGKWRYIKGNQNKVVITHLNNFKVISHLDLKEYFNILMREQK